MDVTDASAETYRELALKAGIVQGGCWPHVVAAEERLFVKNDAGQLCCYALGK